MRLVLLCLAWVVLASASDGGSSSSSEALSDHHEIDTRGEFSRILRQEPASFYRILRKPTTFSRIMRQGPATFSRIMRGGDDESEASKRQSFSRILRSGFTRIQRAYDEDEDVDADQLARDERASAMARILRSAPHLARILRGQDFSRIL